MSEKKDFFVWRWLKAVWRFIVGYFALIGFLTTILPLVLIYSFGFNSLSPQSSLQDLTKRPKDAFSLLIDMRSPISEKQESQRKSFLRHLFGAPSGLYLPDVRSRMRDAAADSLVKDIYLFCDGLQAPMAELVELRRILEQFREESKKPIRAYASHIDNEVLYLASVADEFTLAPAGEVMIPGPVLNQVYFGDAIRRLGVDLQVVRAGKFKSAFEPLVRNEPSPESREESVALESSMRQQMIQTIAAGRGVDEAEVAQWLKRGVFTTEDALKMNMVDFLGYPELSFDDEEDATSHVDIGAYVSPAVKRSPAQKTKSGDGLAVIEAVGEIGFGGSDDDESSITPEAIIPEIRWAKDEENVKAVVLRITSPGGVATAADVIWKELKDLSEAKPLIVSMGSVAASGGYYMAAPAKKIFAEAATITGSIGVIGLIPNFSRLKEKWGVSFHAVTGSERKGLVDPGTKLSKEDNDLVARTVDQTYQTFLSRVAEGRQMKIEEVHALAQGRVYTGEQALKIKLVDSLGGLRDAMQEAKTQAGFDPNELYPLYRYEKKSFSIADCLSSISSMRRCLSASTRLQHSLARFEALPPIPRWVKDFSPAGKKHALILSQWLGGNVVSGGDGFRQ